MAVLFVRLFAGRVRRTNFVVHTFSTSSNVSSGVCGSTSVSPNVYAWQVYVGLMVLQLALAWVVPGFMQEGLVVVFLGYKSVMYKCDVIGCIYITMIAAATLDYYSMFCMREIIENFGYLMTVAMIVGLGVSFFISQGCMSGSFIYGVFMGRRLNVRIGHVDLKMWLEVRVLRMHGSSTSSIWLRDSLIMSQNVAFMRRVHRPTWDIFQEKWGSHVILWNFAGVPFIYSVIYMATHDPFKYELSAPTYIALYGTLPTAPPCHRRVAFRWIRTQVMVTHVLFTEPPQKFHICSKMCIYSLWEVVERWR
ncbi:ergosterol biosynthesis ERG4/ERG24 family-domain-containing protein [Ganoderma leucocontextum]|nr:ergosterol biosynthesis ERG4/ERG24 family-domain-containing protein [Ganoderma leucocontextum]